MLSLRIPLSIAIAVALVAVAGASAESIDGYTAGGAPSHVKPLTQTTFTITLTNKAASPEAADKAKIGIPAGFVVAEPVNASASAAGVCVASTWGQDGTLIADGKINLKRPTGGGSTNTRLCPGATLTVVFSATSAAGDGPYVWATELLRGEDTFVLSGSQPSVRVDGTPPAVTISSHPTDPSNVTSPSFTFSASEAASLQCKVDGGSFAACISPKGYNNLDDGSHTFTVKATDPAGNTGEASYSWLIETTLPIVTLTDKPSQASNTSAAGFSFTASKPASFECKLDGGAFGACTSPASYTNLGEGPHTFAVKATDAAANTGPPTSYTWTVDTVSPVATITQKPSDPSNDPLPAFGFSASEAVTFACKLDGAAFAHCTSPKEYTPGNGAHTFTVKATDAAGNAGQASYSWTIDTVPPAVTITQKPNNPSNVAAPSFGFSASEPAQCKLDAGPFVACTSPTDYSELVDGSHAFTLKATDAAGNTGEASYAWTIDTVAPTTTITKAPNHPSGVSSATFEFSANEPLATLQCKRDSEQFAACTSPKPYTNLSDELHTFTVKATDPAGNTGNSASYDWLVETDLPVVALTATPGQASSSSAATFFFTANKSGATFECKLDGFDFTGCGSPQPYTGLADGTHTFAVRATGTGGTGPATIYSWTVDTTGPATAITQKPADPTNSRSATFTFSASEPLATFQCKLDDAAFASCTSPQTYGDLGEGRHNFVVRALDALSNVGPETAYAWTIDTRAPAVAVTAGPTGLTNSSAASVSFSADEPSTFQCDLDGRGFEPCSSPAAYGGLSDGGHAFAVRATDAAGNVGAASRSWTVDATAPQTTLDSRPAARTTATSARFTFSASEPATFECRLGAASFSPCPSPKTYAGLARGLHSFAVRAIDPAGNIDATPAAFGWAVARRITRTVTRSALWAPTSGARVTSPPLLRWRAVSRATYYNVQLYRAGRKVLTAWPTRARLQLGARWTFNKRVQRLAPGVYRWYVWPGYGKASARRYGRLLGTTSFVVVR
jgi:large repetitive protein